MSALLRIEDLSVHFPIRKGLLQRQVAEVRAVEQVTLSLNRGEAFGLVGESGCGKTTLARTVLRLVDPTSGEIWFDGKNVSGLKGKSLAPYRKQVAAIFQDPFSSLNPRMTAGKILSEVLYVHRYEGSIPGRVAELLSLCGLAPRFADLYPHEMSGGQRQRVGIARALALDPELIVCDEAVSALDVSIQAQIINLLEELRAKFGLTYLFIGHDLSVVRHLCDRLAVMYLGRIVETGTSEELFSSPRHPYTKALIDAVPAPDPDDDNTNKHGALAGEIPSPLNPPPGCVFHTRCPVAMDHCKSTVPPLSQLGGHHAAACFAVEPSQDAQR
ncbi:Oligopeptide transport ATP-binding protein OppF [Candidatus Rhodobacter oscarellae]|uniref:Oligopeptide transport ATP-binding protein OppF n=1 Tax=Candidatus Rhodobacter oscarellae TaxID=1675527 RepID=A0A0J9H3X3_9RHOB|nr:ABC transporter ATP-binding protein [Candidatus Rhodobacter lobularis]KMW60383.1 Oligopeptide transport ATP-binding protein OppF [Candidatus Rhodobacter lobularis]